MRIVVVGSGPIGTFSGLMLARRGHQVLLVDRDAGPPSEADWRRRGVMQFDLPHFFRWIVRQAICDEVPELWSALLLAGGIPAAPPGMPAQMTGLQCRRSTFERTVWAFATAEPGVHRLTGHADGLSVHGGRVEGVVVDGATVEADLVIVSTGRSGRIGDDLRAPAEGGPCGFSYTARQYRARPGVDLPEWGMPRRALHDGYETIVFPQDGGTISALFVRPSGDPLLSEVRSNQTFQAAAAAIPNLAPWTDPDRFVPITDVRSGSNLANLYRGQLGATGRVVPGVLFLGDAVCSTNPAAGRGVALGVQQAREMVRLLEIGTDPADVATEFDQWCNTNIRPWFDDHVHWDATELARFRGEDIDLDGRIPSDVVCACAQVDPTIMAAAGPYLGMLAGPAVLDQVQEKARDVLRTGWRPPFAEGPNSEQLARLTLAPAG
ncbi:MAG TPA: FAD-dependent oxidoreductase [Acidimicrobiales bacterium]|nr:FAD-dependent oxidoreductase [Acidimicrobiales bacterium]